MFLIELIGMLNLFVEIAKLSQKKGAFLILTKQIFTVFNTGKVSFQFENNLFILTACSFL